MTVITIVALLIFLAVPQAISASNPNLERCQCPVTEKRPIGRHIGMVQVIQPNSFCQDMEIIATLKKDGKRVCLDPDAHWVKIFLEWHKAQQKL